MSLDETKILDQCLRECDKNFNCQEVCILDYNSTIKEPFITYDRFTLFGMGTSFIIFVFLYLEFGFKTKQYYLLNIYVLIYFFICKYLF